MSAGSEVLLVTCKCGGVIFVAALGYGHDVEHIREAAKLVKRGFTMRMPVPVAEFRATPFCNHHGDCTTGKKRKPAQVKSEQQGLGFEDTP